VLEGDQEAEGGPDEKEQAQPPDGLEAERGHRAHDLEDLTVELPLEGHRLGRATRDLKIEQAVDRLLETEERRIEVAEHAEGQHADHQQRHHGEDRAIGQRGRHLAGLVLAELPAAVPGEIDRKSQEALGTAQLRHRVADQPLDVGTQPAKQAHGRIMTDGAGDRGRIEGEC